MAAAAADIAYHSFAWTSYVLHNYQTTSDVTHTLQLWLSRQPLVSQTSCGHKLLSLIIKALQSAAAADFANLLLTYKAAPAIFAFCK